MRKLCPPFTRVWEPVLFSLVRTREIFMYYPGGDRFHMAECYWDIRYTEQVWKPWGTQKQWEFYLGWLYREEHIRPTLR